MPKFILRFDEFFKLMAKVFFEALQFSVQTEVEIFKLPKKADVLVIRKENVSQTEGFQVLNYWKTYNILSFKSPAEKVRLSDISDCIIYFLGYTNLEKNADWNNTTVTLIAPYSPAKFLKQYREITSQIAPGHFKVKLTLFDLHILDLSKLPLSGIDSEFLLGYGPSQRLESLAKALNKPGQNKIMDKLREVFYLRISNFEDKKIWEDLMARLTVKKEADITDLVMPYYQKGREEEKENTVIHMHKNGFDIRAIQLATGLSGERIKEILE